MDDGGSPYGNPPSLIIAVAIMSRPRSPKSNKCSSNWFPMNNRKNLGKIWEPSGRIWQTGDKPVYFWVVPLSVNKHLASSSKIFSRLFDIQRWMFSGAVRSYGCIMLYPNFPSIQTTIKLWYPVSPFPTLRQDGRPQGEVLSCKNVLRFHSFTLRNHRFFGKKKWFKDCNSGQNSAFKWTTHDFLKEVCWSTERRQLESWFFNHFD